LSKAIFSELQLARVQYRFNSTKYFLNWSWPECSTALIQNISKLTRGQYSINSTKYFSELELARRQYSSADFAIAFACCLYTM